MSIGLGFELAPRQQLEQKLVHRLELKHEHKLKYLLRLSLELHEPARDVPHVAGYLGMCTADDLLRERGASGILIGSLGSKVWSTSKNYRTNLASSKDVDVLVLDPSFKLSADFEAGIDWWLPKQGSFTHAWTEGAWTGKTSWYENGNGVALLYRPEVNGTLGPGLFIPNPGWIVNMRMREILAQMTTEQYVNIDDEVLEALPRRLGKYLSDRVPTFMQERFKNRILDPRYTDERICRVLGDGPLTISRDEYRAILNRHAR
jgi:hypothetical protein